MSSLENNIKHILFQIGKDINIHKMPDGNLILDIDYDKYVQELMQLIAEEGIQSE